jgi:hypothetical protein
VAHDGLSKRERDSAPAEALSYLNQGVSGGGYLRTLFGLIRNAPGESILPGQGKQGVSSWGTPAKGRTTKPSAKALIATLVYIIVEVRIYQTNLEPERCGSEDDQEHHHVYRSVLRVMFPWGGLERSWQGVPLGKPARGA